MLTPQTDDQTDGLKGGEDLSRRELREGARVKKQTRKTQRACYSFKFYEHT